ncbi:3-deoxy-8-phosphooctulonate synthase [Desulfonatronovibrio hydrogenovorans]|uniref:3-deoxy-8-phosphooctulonate synthase n=1 Tax=Desulfonatronovibrio hydrogenovorans TaxID=53245 RepID=UPI00048CD304|nr:3-deoxy-8-phosphooctulonate synthase [Desulfonatronovibrio hydrogenovorans]
MLDIFTASRRNFFLILGPCVLEGLEKALDIAQTIAEVSRSLQVPVVFKSSFDKANRTSGQSFRGPGINQGLEWLSKIRSKTGLPVITDIHSPDQAEPVAQVADIIQIPAFLCRQTDILLAAARTGKIINIKKGQFLAPWDMSQAVDKISSAGNQRIWLTERGTCFGYNNLVVDFRSLKIMEDLGFPVIFDATHSVQIPGGKGSSSGGQREFVPVLAKAAAAAGARGIFMEVHPDPDQALCDGPNSWPLDRLKPLVKTLLNIRHAAQS